MVSNAEPPSLLDSLCQLTHRRVFEDIGRRQLDLEVLFDGHRHFDDQQRVAAEFEEVVVHCDSRSSREGPPRARSAPVPEELGTGPRSCDRDLGIEHHVPESLPINLAVRKPRQTQRAPPGGSVSCAPAASLRDRRASSPGRPRATCDERPPVEGPRVPECRRLRAAARSGDDGGLSTPGRLENRGLDFARLYSIAAKLDLFVLPAQEHQPPVEPSGPSGPRYDSGARRAPVPAWKRSAVRSARRQ